MKQWIVVFTLAHAFRVFRLVDEKPDARVMRYASIIYDATNVNPECVVKDRYGMFNPEIHQPVSNSVIHMYIASIMEKPDGMGITIGERS
jgi:hypothetical protein